MHVIAAWIDRTLGMDKMERQRRENDRLVLEIEEQQQADERAARYRVSRGLGLLTDPDELFGKRMSVHKNEQRIDRVKP